MTTWRVLLIDFASYSITEIIKNSYSIRVICLRFVCTWKAIYFGNCVQTCLFISCSKLVRWPWHHSIIEISIARRCSSGKMAGTASFMFRLTFLFLVPFFRNDGFSTTGVEGNPDAKRLYDDLLSHYNRLIRPVSNNSQVVTVGLGLHLTQLIDLVCIIFRQKKVFL